MPPCAPALTRPHTHIIYDSMMIMLKDLCTVPVLLLKGSETDLSRSRVRKHGYPSTIPSRSGVHKPKINCLLIKCRLNDGKKLTCPVRVKPLVPLFNRPWQIQSSELVGRSCVSVAGATDKRPNLPRSLTSWPGLIIQSGPSPHRAIVASYGHGSIHLVGVTC